MFAREIDHALGRMQRLHADAFVDVYLVAAAFQHFGQISQSVHRHPRAVGAGYASRPRTNGRRLHECLARCSLAHFVEDAVVGGDDEGGIRQIVGGLDQLSGGADYVGEGDDIFQRSILVLT